MQTVQKQLVLNKGMEKYIFRYDSDGESQILEAMATLARDKKTSFDWFDAAVLSFRLAQSLITQADKLLHRDMCESIGSLDEKPE